MMSAADGKDEEKSEDDVDYCSRISPPVNFNAKASFLALGLITMIRIATFW